MLFRDAQGKEMDDNGNNWLGFSLSPTMKMEVASVSSDPQHLPYSHHFQHHQAGSSPYASSSFFFPSSSFFCDDDNGGSFHSGIPLKSDGTLCIMEALSKSQGMLPNPSPKLEDFLGGASMGAHQYDGHGHDSMYCHQEHDPPSSNPFGVNTSAFYSGMTCHGIFQAPVDDNQEGKNHISGCDSELSQMHGDGMLKGWHNLGGIGYGDLQSLSLSMSPGSQSSCVTASRQMDTMIMDTKKRILAKGNQKEPVHRKSIDTFGQRTSQYRGVTRHRWTGRYEAHLWDNSCKKEGQTRKGRQVYLGGYDTEEKAARAYDLAALKYWGPSTHINFPLENYGGQLEEMKNMTRQEYVAHLRRKSSGFSRGASIYRGVTRHHQHGRWQARIGRVAGNKDLYLGTFSTQEEAAEAYDIAAIKFRGANAVTNFDITRYDVERIIASNTLLAGELARKSKENGESNSLSPGRAESVLSLPVPEVLVVDQSMDESGMKIGEPLSNTSSMVSSLNSSREGSPDKTGSAMFSKAQGSVGSWFRATPAISVSQMPVFGSSWNDS